MMKQMGAAAMVLALLLLLFWRLQRRGLAGLAGSMPLIRKSTARRLASIERLPLGPHHVLHLVRCGDDALLVSASAAGCALLHRANWLEFEKGSEGK